MEENTRPPTPAPETPKQAVLCQPENKPDFAQPPDGNETTENADQAAKPMDPCSLLNTVEALLFAAEEPLPLSRIAEIGTALMSDSGSCKQGADRLGVSLEAVRNAVAELNRCYEDSGRTFRIHRIAQGLQLYTLPEFARPVRLLYRRQLVQRLSGAALEVLAIIAYRQPVTRPEVEQLRGVDCSGPLVTLMERQLIATAGRAQRPGSPFLYRTTREFLRYFGLETLEDLPPVEQLEAFLAEANEEAGRQIEIETEDQLAIGDRRIIEAARAQETPPPAENDAPENSQKPDDPEQDCQGI